MSFCQNLCRFCRRASVRRHGFTESHNQRYFCRQCSRSFVEEPGSTAYSEQRKAEILRAHAERTSLRGIERIFGVSRHTVAAWLKQNSSSPPTEIAPAQSKKTPEH